MEGVTPEKEMISMKDQSVWRMSSLVANKEINGEINDETNEKMATSGNSANISKEIPAMEKPSRPSFSFLPRTVNW